VRATVRVGETGGPSQAVILGRSGGRGDDLVELRRFIGDSDLGWLIQKVVLDALLLIYRQGTVIGSTTAIVLNVAYASQGIGKALRDVVVGINRSGRGKEGAIAAGAAKAIIGAGGIVSTAPLSLS